ncbi:TlpA disulfide reductase family protein [Cardiobacterium valvarum]|uniref:Cytochrome c biogenesis protein tlpA n=1 Tax=Cardiobacterium valvarum TaxID=194702 RepID=A0A381E1T8_9GAMM|nr:TlpA disulfide reductase family protein [Cardiobacterium valvarum]SUX19820.1 Cytochrome c biogenesis protein tlpA [Cardiobacterium valvarum]
MKTRHALAALLLAATAALAGPAVILPMNPPKAECTPPEGFLPASAATPLGELIKYDGKHKVALLNVWALWCTPCRAELPLLDQLAQREDTPFDIITLNLGDDAAQIDALFADLKINKLPRDNSGDSSLLKRLGGVGLPLSAWYVDGKMVAKSTGALHDGDALLAYAQCLARQAGDTP